MSAHQTRSMAASWLAGAGLLMEAICKAASWSTTNAFISHYCGEPADLTSLQFGKAVLQAAVSV